MKNKRINDRGFSLVELIVVILIMAIVAVAVSVQVVRWIRNARISDDIQLMDSLVSTMQVTVMANEAANKVAEAEGVKLTIGNRNGRDYNSFVKLHPAGENLEAGNAVYDLFMQNLEVKSLNVLKVKNPNTEIVINVSKDVVNISSEYVDISADGSRTEIEIDN